MYTAENLDFFYEIYYRREIDTTHISVNGAINRSVEYDTYSSMVMLIFNESSLPTIGWTNEIEEVFTTRNANQNELEPGLNHHMNLSAVD